MAEDVVVSRGVSELIEECEERLRSQWPSKEDSVWPLLMPNSPCAGRRRRSRSGVLAVRSC
ncbi:MAG: hypothetical protein ACLUEQ_06890 [Cloacibacillus evryensis]